MLAIRLHSTRKPWLDRGTFLIPMPSWETARMQICGWLTLLNKVNKRQPGNKQFITLVRIPDDHPVDILRDGSEKCFRDPDFKPTRQATEAMKDKLRPRIQWLREHCDPERVSPADERSWGLMPGSVPELVLGALTRQRGLSS